MLKHLIYSAIWIFTIFLLVAATIRTTEDNIINTINSSLYYNYQQDCGWLNNFQDPSVNFTHVFQRIINRCLNESCVYNPSIAYIELEINNLKNTVNDLEELRAYQEKRRNSVHYKWKRRTLCAVNNDEKYLKTFNGNAPDDSNAKEGKKTLMDYDEPSVTDDTEDPNSLETHVRVKRSKSDWGPSLKYQQEYLKDLANSFPRSTYESINDNLYDDDISFDAKREIKSQELFVNEHETDGLKMINTRQSAISNENDESIKIPPERTVIDNSQTSNQEILSEKESSKDSSLMNRRSIDENMEIQNFPEDLLAVDLVRKKRNNLIGKSLLDDKTEQRLNNEDEKKKLSRVISADLKAHLLRLKRRAKNSGEKNSKTKKKKKHTGKKEDKNSRRSLTKSVNKLRTPRARKANGVRSEGKSNVGITKVVSKKNNNNFHRRFVESNKSKYDHSSKNLALDNNAVNSDFKREPSVVTGSDADGLAADAQNRNEEPQAFQKTRSREKRNKNTEASHGFLSKEDELRYYENIREPESEIQRADKKQRSLMAEVKGERAVRSIEEVKELAKKLVTKVNELQNFINAEESKSNEGREKRIQTRAIDDLCSNVSTAYDAFKDPPTIVQKCVPMNHKYSSPAKIVVERKIQSMKNNKESKIVNEEKGHPITEEKRSIVRRVPKTTASNLRTIRGENEKARRKWGRWTDWSSCSVTCGKGRQIRWRYCQRDCSTAETEMEEKACQLPACPPGKFLGIF